MANPYIQLQPSGGTNKYFKVVFGSLQKLVSKAQNRRRTLNGKSDNTEGQPVTGWVMTLRVRNVATTADPDGTSYGVRDDLEGFYALNNPNAAISNRFTFIDNEGDSHTVDLVGQLAWELISPQVDGDNSWYFVSIALEKVNA